MTYLPKEVREGLEAARTAALGRRNRLRVVMADTVVPLLRLWDHGFAVPVAQAPRLRGLVDVHDGGRHLWQCLIVAAAEEGDEMLYEFKRQTAALDRPAPDFVIPQDAPAGLLPSS
ncbi:hypothetical protein OB2597_10224 [Pseudooceanicola batsensis HTCC2597]|uniref:Uncharacterized protein n=1 Tax=Pseudooceanicola batsensis (strain ATCC BAA-863 / DSM 15984 / KCTC 12145 / HTCC2597) TaxID=252305 RepID=A3TVG7_PSEBH|nr:hypothetical protein [Pseudooceanicola batsensis]EAQ04513.1 hypothetical protein OB2597_10224 [Pseudooceanicola batsensis HTCC2597]